MLWQPRAERDLRKLETAEQRDIIAAVLLYAAEGRGNVKKLQGIDPPQWRLRVGDYRVRFRQRGDLMEILHVAHRREAYR